MLQLINIYIIKIKSVCANIILYITIYINIFIVLYISKWKKYNIYF